MSRTRFRTGLVVGVLLLVTLAGCGSEEKATKEEVPGTAVDSAAFVTRLLDAVQEQQTARVGVTLGTSVTVEAAFRYGAAPATDVSVKAFGRTLRVVLVDKLVYLQKAADEKFVVLTEDDPSLASLGGGLTGADPQQVLGGLRDAITEVREIGPATIEGQDLTRFAVTLDRQKIGSSLLGMLPSGDASKDLVLDLYVDADDLLQRAEAELGANDLTLVVSDWGKSVEIVAPPASKVLKN